MSLPETPYAPSRSLAGTKMVMSGGSRGIGLAIALRAAADGASVAIIAKTAEPHPKLPGTVYTAAQEIEDAGGTALPIVGDVRDETSIAAAVAHAAETFGGIDICVNNASAIDLSPTSSLSVKRYDLMQSINTRATFLLSQACLPHLAQSDNAHILTLSPPIDLNPKWAGMHLGYTLSKYGMSLCTIGLAEEGRAQGIAANSLWPQTLIATAALLNLGADEAAARSRGPEIVADAAHAILTRPAGECSGNHFIDEDVLREEGVSDFEPYRFGDKEPAIDLFLEG